MKRIMGIQLFIFLIFHPCRGSKCGPHTDDEYCNGISKVVDNGPVIPNHEKRKWTEQDETPSSWRQYQENIEEAVGRYVEIESPDCGCYNDNIKRDLAPFANGINQSMLDSVGDLAVKYQIVGHKLYRHEKCMFGPRCEGVEHFIHQIIGYLPDMEFYLNPRDYPLVNVRQPLKPVFSFSKVIGQHADIMYPAWAFWSGGPAITHFPSGIGRWDKMRIELDDAAKEHPWSSKDARALFRGSRTSAERDPLVLLSREKPRLIDAQYTKNQAWKSDKDTLGLPPAELTHFVDHCKYRHLFNFRGVAASFRLKHLFLCNSLVYHVGVEWQEFFYPQLVPWVHHVPVETHLHNVEDLLAFFNKRQDLAEQIAQRGRDFIWHHLRQEDVSCYWRRLLRRYVKLLDFEVVRDETLMLRTNDMIRQK